MVDDGIGQIQLVLGTGDGDVEEAAFFFERFVAAFVDDAFVKVYRRLSPKAGLRF